MKKKLQCLMMISIIFWFIICIGNQSFADTWKLTDVKTLEDQTATEAGVAGSAKAIVGTIIQVMKIVGTGASVIMLIMVAVKYMSAAPSERAEFKKSATAYIVGAIVLFAVPNILSVLQSFSKNITNS